MALEKIIEYVENLQGIEIFGMITVGTLVILLLSIWYLWIFYLAVMALKRARDNQQLTFASKILGYPVLFIGYILDVFVNIFVMSFIFLEVPKETLVTSRLKRWCCASPSWRQRLARWLCENLLNQFDPSGKHC